VAATGQRPDFALDGWHRRGHGRGDCCTHGFSQRKIAARHLDFSKTTMITNERTWPSQRKLFRPVNYSASLRTPRPFAQDETLKTVELQIERKSFFLTLKENPRGRFLRISEEASNRRNSIIIPTTGLHEFQKIVEEMLVAAGAPANPPASSDL
jgi:hypothetical protein